MISAHSLGSTIMKVKLSRLVHLMVTIVNLPSRAETTNWAKQTHPLLMVLSDWLKLKFLNPTSSSGHLKTSQTSSSSCKTRKLPIQITSSVLHHIF